jgi:protein phosphatase
MDEITADYEVSETVTAVPLRVRTSLVFGAKTDIGRVRENNEDKYEFFLPGDDAMMASRGQAFLVCDGMGGHEAGQIASETASKTWLDIYFSHPAESCEAAASAATTAANRFVLDRARNNRAWTGMGTTLTALAVVQDMGVIAHVGDSRAYLLREGEVQQLTTDHTWVEETVASGLMSREEAESHPYRHMITRAIGTEVSIGVDCFSIPLQEGDLFLLCSDGVTNHVTNEELPALLNTGGSPSEIAWNVVKSALAGGGSDNATALVVRITGLAAV